MFLNQYTKYFVTFTNESGELDHMILGRIQYHILRLLRRRGDGMSVTSIYNYTVTNWVNKPPISSFYISIHSLVKKGFVKKVKRRGLGTARCMSKHMYQIDKLPKNLFVQINTK